MAPNKEKAAAIDDDRLETLCVLMATATEFNPDFDAAAAALNIAQPRNVTRKINSIIEPLGYTMQRKKITKLSDDSDAATMSKISKKPAIKTKLKGKAAAKKASTDKRKTKKVASNSSDKEADDESDGDKEEETDNKYSPATKAIMEAMAGSDVTPDEDSSSDEDIEGVEGSEKDEA